MKTIIIISGGVSLGLGLWFDFVCFKLRDEILGRGKLGLSVGMVYTEEDLELRKRKYINSKRYLKGGIALTALGIILNIFGALLT